MCAFHEQVRIGASTAAVIATAGTTAFLPTNVAGFAHLLAFSFWLGSSIWVNVAGLIMFKYALVWWWGSRRCLVQINSDQAYAVDAAYLCFLMGLQCTLAETGCRHLAFVLALEQTNTCKSWHLECLLLLLLQEPAQADVWEASIKVVPSLLLDPGSCHSCADGYLGGGPHSTGACQNLGSSR